MEEEIWKPIVGYEDLYEVSNLGRVKALEKTQIMPGNGGIKVMKEIIVKPWLLMNRYWAYSLSKNNKVHKETVHRLIAIHFISNPENYPYVRHLDDNPKNNSLDNLAWGTQKMNMQDKVNNNTQMKGENVPNSILTEEDVINIKKKYNRKTCNYIQLAALYNVNKVTIGDILRGTTWKHIKIDI